MPKNKNYTIYNVLNYIIKCHSFINDSIYAIKCHIIYNAIINYEWMNLMWHII
jgi:hypothetical protein